MLLGASRVGGSLNLGPASAGVDAKLTFAFVDCQNPGVDAEVCGHVDLFLFEISGCAHISIGSDPIHDLPPPTVHPLDRVDSSGPGPVAYLVGDEYRRIPLTPVPDGVPVVWPDAIIHFQFATAPTLPVAPAMQQFPGAATYPEGLRARPIGTKRSTTTGSRQMWRWSTSPLVNQERPCPAP